MTASSPRHPVIVRPGTTRELSVLGVGVEFLCEATETEGRFSLMSNRLPFGAGPPPHRHDWDEAYYVVSGRVDFMIEGEPVVAEAGTFLLAPAGTLHGFAGGSQDPALMLVFDAPAHAAAFFREVDREVKSPADFPRVPALGAAHGIHFAAA